MPDEPKRPKSVSPETWQKWLDRRRREELEGPTSQRVKDIQALPHSDIRSQAYYAGYKPPVAPDEEQKELQRWADIQTAFHLGQTPAYVTKAVEGEKPVEKRKPGGYDWRAMASVPPTASSGWRGIQNEPEQKEHKLSFGELLREMRGN